MDEKIYHPGEPDKENGVEMLEGMNERHKVLRDFALPKITFTDGMKMLDVGCGGGAMIAELLKKSKDSHVDGVDYSDASMEVAGKTLAAEVGKRVALQKADVAKLPFADDTYDLVTAVETTYFWKDMKEAFREIRRVLKVGGVFAVIVEGSDPEAHKDWPDPDHDITIWRPQDYIDLFWKTGYGEIQVDHGEGDMLMVRGQKLAKADGFRGSFE